MPDSFQDCADSLPWVYAVDWSSSAFEVHGQLPGVARTAGVREPTKIPTLRPKVRSPRLVDEENNLVLAEERQSLEARIRDSVMAEIRAALRSVSEEATEELRAAAAEIRRLRTTATAWSDGLADTAAGTGRAGLEVVSDLRFIVEEIKTMLNIQDSNLAVVGSVGSREPSTLTVDTQQLPDSSDGETSDDGDAATGQAGNGIPGRKLRRKSDGSRRCATQHGPGPDEVRSRQAGTSCSTAGGSSSLASVLSTPATAIHRSNSCSREFCLHTDLPDSNCKRPPVQKSHKAKSPRVRDVVSRLERQLEKCNSPAFCRSPHPPRSAPVRRVRPPSLGCVDDASGGARTPRKSDSFTLLHTS